MVKNLDPQLYVSLEFGVEFVRAKVMWVIQSLHIIIFHWNLWRVMVVFTKNCPVIDKKH